MTRVTICNNGCVVATSRNLRGVREYARRVGILEVRVYTVGAGLPEGAADVQFLFANGAVCWHRFASRVVLAHWLRARRAWRHLGIVRTGVHTAVRVGVRG